MSTSATFVVLERTDNGDDAKQIRITELDADCAVLAATEVSEAGLPSAVAERESTHPRWVWASTASWYPGILDVGLRVERCVDLALCRAILVSSALSGAVLPERGEDSYWATANAFGADVDEPDEALFDLGDAGSGPPAPSMVAELTEQLTTVARSTEPGRLRLLLAAESAGALVAAEMRFAGLPWHVEVHDALLTELLGERPRNAARPRRMEELVATIRDRLGAPNLNPDSQAELLKALRSAGLLVSSTRAWELRELDHPAISPLLEYKKLARLLSANGWAWMETWIVDGRFHPDYVPGGVVTGRWATRGGGALQLPKQVRAAVVADPGWKLVVADASQLEPRVLAGLSSDRAMADAGRGRDLYDGFVASGVVDTRAHAKVAMLGAMYGSTTGDSARLVPRLSRAFPRALALVENAARAGERGEVVTSRLGRSSPRPGADWSQTQSKAFDPAATAIDERRARSRARDWGRFTRNFVVQASAAEWALCWMADLRNELAKIVVPSRAAGAAGGIFARSPHLVFFLHDEVIVHAPEEHAGRVTELISESARRAGELLFGSFPVDFPLSVAVVDDYAQAK
jgi:DNA polymerase-1